jgi:hypothetical protein
MSDEGARDRSRQPVDRDRSPVVELLLAQYRALRAERVVVATTVRIFWFVLLLTALLSQSESFEDFFTLFIIGGALFYFSFATEVRVARTESSIRNSLVRLDPDLEDYYIRELGELGLRVFHLTPIYFLRKYEELFWFGTYLVVLGVQFIRVQLTG